MPTCSEFPDIFPKERSRELVNKFRVVVAPHNQASFERQRRIREGQNCDSFGAERQGTDIESLGDCLRVLGDGQSLGEFSLTIVLHAEDKGTLDRVLPDVVRIFTSADGTLFSETYNQLNAYFATIPGNYHHNLRRHYLLNSNYADISFLFTIQPGETWNDHLDREYLAVLETDNATPYYLNLHNREVAHTLILGATGSGKSSY